MGSIGSFKVAAKTISGATTEKPREPDFFEFEGEKFTVIDYQPSALPMMELADAIQSGVDEDSFPALAAMYQMLQHCLAEADWPRFRRVAMASRATVDDVMPIVSAVWEAVTGNPTHGPSESPDGPSNTSTKFVVDLPPQDTDQPSPSFPAGWTPPPGRPDLAVALMPVDTALHRVA